MSRPLDHCSPSALQHSIFDFCDANISDVPPLDQISELDADGLTPDQRFWHDNGYLIMKNASTLKHMEAYMDSCPFKDNTPPKLGGYGCTQPYVSKEPMQEILLNGEVMEKMKELIGEELGLNLALTGWQSTQREWHQDDYLNPGDVHGFYIAVWYALEDIHPDAGPLTLVPGTHKWPLLRREKVWSVMRPRNVSLDPNWPKYSEEFLTPLFENEFEREQLKNETFLAKKGDVLLWHARLAHEGSAPKDASLTRKAIIGHYTSLKRSPALWKGARKNNGGWTYSALPGHDC